jgi:hypothetical protein
MPYCPHDSLRARRVEHQRWPGCGAPLRFFLVIGLLLLTAHRLPAPVVEGPAPFKRTFFTLKGHAVDTFANEQKLPPELDLAFGGVTAVVVTRPLTELTALMRKFGRVLGDSPSVLSTDFSGARSPETQRREAAIQTIAEAQLKKIATKPTLPAAAGLSSTITFLASKFPSAFFTGSDWSIESYQADELLTKAVRRPSRARMEIPIFATYLRLFKYATKGDIDILRRTSAKTNFWGNPGNALMQFYADVCHGGTPQRLLPIEVVHDECGSITIVTVEPPSLQLRVVVLENITNEAIELGEFHFRLLDPGRGMLTVRTRAENETLLASTSADSAVWYKPRIVKPGEKVIVPLELLFRPNRSTPYDSGMEPAATRARRRACARQLLADRELQTISLVYEGRDRKPQNPIPLVGMPKQKFVDGLLREPIPATDKEEFVYGPSVALDSVDVNGSRHAIDPFDPINVAYFSGYEKGSCPFVYGRRTMDGEWLKQGTILTGRSSKAREATDTLEIHVFDGTLRIAEEEDEISYIDELFVRGTLVNGDRVTLRPLDDRIAHKDFRYLVLEKGESVEIKFSPPDGMRGDRVEVVASGYFELSQRPVAQ